ncbi:Mannose-P-dolichol utilization defect 1 protein, putative [Perkinsus marinus ATCC 50983]|uniref:Mannose-P-dolichol utilization defect 1 protein homolog n=1 Tax=Perkinsus marinus (strain ATCC 50983 / TXsc) TaxID=423536 RepID=C5LHD8_PERM5|nr:Mannose-P-dolichol utilization defect 1 protein, putative [Perkinsus marinus ATCC 50983]EER03947.1 Mannose-P-dolichol utilization defect 1 protein, putative [Perkinsus marinus ATCC 50983]|eukprot:XP_002772131.1 Mannose-P-dolichol utilization defect 1 protein, putative [Perkinsus marinus ATCC 50983]
MSSKILGLVSQECLDKFMAFDIEKSCVNEFIVNGLNMGIMAGALAVKMPQIIKIFANKSVQGISEASFALEFIASSLFCTYNMLMRHPFAAWGEMFFVSVQCMILLCLFWWYAPQIDLLPRVLLMNMGSFGFMWAMSGQMPEQFLPLLGMAPAVLGIAARLPQIALNFKQGNTGHLAFLTFFLSFMGNLARIFTTLKQLNDPVTLASHVCAALCNGTIVAQILYYWNATKASNAQEEKGKKAKKEE